MATELEDLRVLKTAEVIADEIYHQVGDWNDFARDGVSKHLTRLSAEMISTEDTPPFFSDFDIAQIKSSSTSKTTNSRNLSLSESTGLPFSQPQKDNP